MNNDVKQTALQATPWLRDAESEEEQMRAVANYLDTASMRAQHDKLLADLAGRQNSDGGWAWMPDGKSSLWVTQAVLQKVKGEDLDTKKALRYVDNEQQRYFERWVKPYIKKYDEEREQTVMFVVDLSASGQFGSKNITKKDLIAEITAVLAFSALKNGDRAGLLAFTDIIEHYIKPEKNKKHILRLIDTILSYKPQNKRTNIENALKYLNKLCKKKVLVFLISDFYDVNFDSMLKVVAKKHDFVCIKILDPKEQELPKKGIFMLQDAETDLLINVDFSSKKVGEEYYKNLKRYKHHLDEVFRDSKTDVMNIYTDRSYVLELINFFKSRQEKMSRHCK